nr:acylneuraminate cytidylyltransferase family protein [uncultured Celeribacter sp.]
MSEMLTCFLPCRKGSERVPRKNIKPFAGNDSGLVEVKLAQLLATVEIDRVIISTNDEEILDYAQSLKSSKLTIHHREEALASSSASTDQLVAHAHSLIDAGHILWTHVTSPFVTAEIYTAIITKYWAALEQGYDSLMTTTPVQGFLWKEDAPINYDRGIEKWPRTQTLDPVHEVNSAAFVAHRDIYGRLDDRIGRRPYLFPMDKLVSHDIDWPEDFLIAEALANAGLVKT